MTIFAMPVFDATVIYEGKELFKGQGAASMWAEKLSREIGSKVTVEKIGTGWALCGRVDEVDCQWGGPLAWTTGIPAAKLYAALELGESLTSMYMRINDTVFEPDVERDLADADVVDDPLIRCLFGDTFGAYQAAQLRRLLGRGA
jgi:hypothetical protein